MTKEYRVPTKVGVTATLLWPVPTANGPIAIIKVENPYKQVHDVTAANLSVDMAKMLHKDLKAKFSTLLMLENAGTAQESAAMVGVTCMETPNHDVNLVWDYKSLHTILKLLSLAPAVLSEKYPLKDIPKTSERRTA
ncbi:hypothetical protein [Pseudomonas serbica]|uniref:hypothetical protein n=1 Tax=Pseudomonas serbica TaxID=2965074 RepID=UPI00237B6DE8|nr:hypothetical protein [Pseudomonas serbica]